MCLAVTILLGAYWHIIANALVGVRLTRCSISACGSFDGAKLAIDGFVGQGGISNPVFLVA
jgi:hypothetical protein